MVKTRFAAQLLEFFKDNNGNNSSKRLGGLFCLAQGSLMKLCLFFYGLNHTTATPFNKLDNCADSMIYVGAGLLGWGVVELLGKKKK
jgi:hypothetical protein